MVVDHIICTIVVLKDSDKLVETHSCFFDVYIFRFKKMIFGRNFVPILDNSK